MLVIYSAYPNGYLYHIFELLNLTSQKKKSQINYRRHNRRWQISKVLKHLLNTKLKKNKQNLNALNQSRIHDKCCFRA